MELVYCQNCKAPKQHMTKDFYGKRVHGGDKCLTCGEVHYTPDELELIDSQMAQHELSLIPGG